MRNLFNFTTDTILGQIELNLDAVGAGGFRVGRPERNRHDAPLRAAVRVERGGQVRCRRWRLMLQGSRRLSLVERYLVMLLLLLVPQPVGGLLQQEVLVLLEQHLVAGWGVDFPQHPGQQSPARQPHAVRHEEDVAGADVQDGEGVAQRLGDVVREAEEAHVAALLEPAGTELVRGALVPGSTLLPGAGGGGRDVEDVQRWIGQLRGNHEHVHARDEARDAPDRLQ
uniref:Serine/threonine specific protein phosphatases domain-containing protein n=1 Tax=Anopheles atroparvus TaxID=41427 RepID=A0A182J1B1_ANOAO